MQNASRVLGFDKLSLTRAKLFGLLHKLIQR
jgi:hypothetical protein